jgi:hypothetical protein
MRGFDLASIDGIGITNALFVVHAVGPKVGSWREGCERREEGI